MPISKQRNKHLQSVLIEAAKLAPRLSPELALVYDTEKQKGHANRASIAVARKLVAYLLAVDRSGREFVVAGERRAAAVGRDEERADSSNATCQVPQKPTGRRSYAPNASFEMFRDWQETLTQSSVTVSTARYSEWMSGSALTRRNRAERHNGEVMNTLSETTRRSPERYGKALPHLTKTYHGCRLLVQVELS